MSTWPNRGGPPAAPAGGWKREDLNPKTVRPRRSDSSQQASSKPGAVQTRWMRPDKPVNLTRNGVGQSAGKRTLKGYRVWLQPLGPVALSALRVCGWE